ncbi:MAG: hypothetical protein ING66_16300 [Rhodocyclaceae bacterium]|jgi:hypothetical protein|nr:hypothetical protein [Rhodocyclaceae bacterium]MCA3021769.1 hypothetical protein [Rhodocyclaceae bacterium]MCA3030145.1 hypothetical protein [Rhodocyclaceae bacterium]MCA3044196.1 hypothetical protein [Rhodocyclaceae bacterium]MCA3057185.1 hypothetical protein [Rhodocyclaceae bacterium]
MKASVTTDKRVVSKPVSAPTRLLHASDPKAAIDALDARFAKLGILKIERIVKVDQKDSPKLFYSSRGIDRNDDSFAAFETEGRVTGDHHATDYAGLGRQEPTRIAGVAMLAARATHLIHHDVAKDWP